MDRDSRVEKCSHAWYMFAGRGNICALAPPGELVQSLFQR